VDRNERFVCAPGGYGKVYGKVLQATSAVGVSSGQTMIAQWQLTWVAVAAG